MLKKQEPEKEKAVDVLGCGGKEMIKVKDIIDSKYEIKEKLREGLFQVIEINLMTPFLIKEIALPPDSDVSEILSVLEELRKVNHRLFPKMVEIIKEEASVLVVMENVSGCCAAELGKEKRRPEIIIDHAFELCEGLAYFSSVPCSEKVSWRLSLKDVFIDGGRVCLHDFSIGQKKNIQKEQEAVILYVKEMLGESLKKMKKLNQRIEEYLQGEASYSGYSEIAEELERQLMEYNKAKKLNKLLTKAGVVAVVLLCLGLGVWKGISIVKPRADTQAASASTDVSIKLTKEPEKQKADPEVKKIVKTAFPKPQETKKISTPKPTDITDVPVKKETVTTNTPNKEVTVARTKTPIVQTRQPSSSGSGQSQRQQSVATRVPVTKKTEKKTEKPQEPDTLEINIEEESNMEIQIKE
ncbi:MAG: hypothetical protein K2N51_08920 [Lachnospiraceae bacterium]|nr:hypothetical protein [Lachnospiraceae bacterium]